MSCISSYNYHVNNQDDTDLDVFFQKLTETMEMEDYINNGKYPDRLKTKIIKKQFPKMEEEFIYEFSNLHNKETDNLNDNLSNIKQSLDTLEQNLKTEIQRENTQVSYHKQKECPICMEELKERNYVMPNCGHPVCVNCFVTNMNINKSAGHLCSECRQHII
jgi:septation ring formation regulator EzrA